jgi:type II secretory pathway component PulC
VRDPDDLFDALQAAGSAGSIQLTVVRGTDERTIDVTFGADAG